jgi:GNAT superfamily N-acetyltransferase
MLRQLTLADMDAAALVHRAAFNHALPWLADLHTSAEERWFFRERVFPTCRVWGAVDGEALLGLIAFREDWVDHLYVLPRAQRQGIGTALLEVAQASFGRLQLWTFQRNRRARRFYERGGLVLVEETDGAGNEEKEPDARYLWMVRDAPRPRPGPGEFVGNIATGRTCSRCGLRIYWNIT